MGSQTYNGWTNYATWRISLELFDGWVIEGDSPITPEEVEQAIEEIVFEETEDQVNQLAKSYARAFLHDVNHHEIAAHINEDRN